MTQDSSLDQERIGKGRTQHIIGNLVPLLHEEKPLRFFLRVDRW